MKSPIKELAVRWSIPVIVFIFTVWAIVMKKPDSHSPFEREKEGISEQQEEKFAYEALKWYNDQRAYPKGSIPVDWRDKALAHIQRNNLQKSSMLNTLSWTTLGSGTISGRTRSVVIDPTNTNVMYCGSVSGGVWKTTNGGGSWFPVTDFASNLAINTLVMDPANSNILYAGTGEGCFPIDALRGIGVLKTTDGGSTWTTLTNFSTPNPDYGYYYINKLVISSANSSILYAGMIGGIWKSTDAGLSWAKLNISTTYISCMDLVANPSNASILYAAFGLHNPDGVYKTTNGGTTWNKLTNGFPPVSQNYHRISLAVAASNTNVIYACLADSNDYTHSIQKSTNGGALWSAVATPFDNDPLVNGTHLGGQGWYDNVIAVDPTNANFVYTGGINLFKSLNGGTNWNPISDGYGYNGHPYVHVDEHAIAFQPGNANVVFFGNDGGVFKTANGGTSFSTLNNSLVTVQFYSIAVHPTLDIYYGGTQDNGTMRFDGSKWAQVVDGDGGPAFVDPTTPTTVYGSYVYLEMYKSTSSGAPNTWDPIMSGIPLAASIGTSDRCSFIAPFTMDPSNSQTLVAGTFKIYRTTNGGTTWVDPNSALPNNGDLTGDGNGAGQVGQAGSTITAIAVASSSSATIYVGTSGSGTATAKIQVTTTTGHTWIDVTKSPLPDRQVTAFAIDPANAQRTFATFSGYNSNTPAPGHVFLTTNGGNSWLDASGDLPDVPVNTIVIDPVNSNHIVVGTDLGVFASSNNGTNWSQQNNGLANVSVAQLVVRADGYLFAGTHGRGMFKTTTPMAVQEHPPAIPAAFVLQQNYPNPFNPTTTIPFSIAQRSYVRLKVFDAAGREVATLVDGELPAGSYHPTFDAGKLASGVYFYTVEARDLSSLSGKQLVDTRKMLLLK